MDKRATLEEFKALRAGVAPEVQTELYGLMTRDPEAGKQRMVAIAAEKGVTLTVDEVKGFSSRWMRRVSLTILSWTRLPLLRWQVVIRAVFVDCHCMTSPGVVALGCVRCANGFLAGPSDGQTRTLQETLRRHANGEKG